MFTKSEGFFLGNQNHKLHYKIWKNNLESETLLVITHGQAEHSDCYTRLVESLSILPIHILGWDLQGHGKSEGQRGYAQNFSDYSKDFQELLKFISADNFISYKNLILLGHSMGGLIQISSLVELEAQRKLPIKLKGQILSSPLLGFSVDVPFFKDIAALISARAFPRLTLFNEIEFSQLTEDEHVIQEMKKDTLRHNKISPTVYLGSIEKIEWLRVQKRCLSMPTLLQIPEVDGVVDSQASPKILQKLCSNGMLVQKKYSSKGHEIYNDLERDQAFKDIIEFLNQFILNK